MSTRKITTVIDLVCPWCFIGKRRLDLALKAASKTGSFEVEWTPFELDSSLPFEGAERLSYRTRRFGSLDASKQRDQMAIEAGKEVGINFNYDLIKLTPNTFLAHQLVWWAKIKGKQNEMVDSLFQAYFLKGKDMGLLEDLLNVVEEVGLLRPEAKSFLESKSGSSKVRELETWAREQNVMSVPSYFFDGKKIDSQTLLTTIKNGEIV